MWVHFTFGSLENFLPIICFDDRKSKFRVIWIHSWDLVTSWCTKHLDDFNKLINTRVTWEQRLTKQKLSNYTSDRPNINWLCIICGAKNKFWCSIISWTNIAHIYFIFHESLSWAEITNFKLMCIWMNEEILWLNVSMAYTKSMDICECPETLIGIKFNQNHGYFFLAFIVMLQNTENCLLYIIHHDI